MYDLDSALGSTKDQNRASFFDTNDTDISSFEAQLVVSARVFSYKQAAAEAAR